MYTVLLLGPQIEQLSSHGQHPHTWLVVMLVRHSCSCNMGGMAGSEMTPFRMAHDSYLQALVVSLHLQIMIFLLGLRMSRRRDVTSRHVKGKTSSLEHGLADRDYLISLFVMVQSQGGHACSNL